jgi:catechol 2,3-dioxygenase-like lactoylglutathione lyase family enzyme
MEISNVAIVSVPVSDQERASGFYTEVLGFDVVADDQMGPDQRWVMVRPSAGGAALTFVTWFPTMPSGSLKGLVLEVDDIDQVAEDLISRSPAAGGIEEAPWGRCVQIDDSEGNGLCYSNPPVAKALASC